MEFGSAAASQHQLVSSLSLEHDDFVHDVQYDFYGNRLATCSSDQKIKIWHKAPVPGRNDQFTWECKQTLAGSDGHKGAVWRVTWADPEFGENGILASCGFDKEVIIWSESDSQIRSQSNQTMAKQWHRKNNFILKEAAQDLKFGPKYHGLILAVAIANGTIKIYQCKDPAVLTNFSEIREINIAAGLGECTCLSWNPAFDEPMSLVVGCHLNQSMKSAALEVEAEKKDEGDAALPKLVNRPDVNLLRLVIIHDEGNKDLDQQIAMNGNLKLTPGVLALKQEEVEALQNDSDSVLSLFHKQMINDVAWAPLAGRSFHFIASCSKDRTVIIWRVVLKDIMKGFDGILLEQPEIRAVQRLDGAALNGEEVQRIKWNILATSFATTSQEGDVKVWQRAEPSQHMRFGRNPLIFSDEDDEGDELELGEVGQQLEDASENFKLRKDEQFFKQLLHFKTK